MARRQPDADRRSALAASGRGLLSLPSRSRSARRKHRPTQIICPAAPTGVAGGELLVPTIVLLYGPDIKLVASQSLAASLSRPPVAFARYSRHSNFKCCASAGIGLDHGRWIDRRNTKLRKSYRSRTPCSRDVSIGAANLGISSRWD